MMTLQRANHPARFTPAVLDEIGELVAGFSPILDPFAGVGGIHRLPGRTVGVELEPEWAAEHPDTLIADALALPFRADSFGAVATSPTYGNRMADHHEAKDGSQRATYRHKLGRALTDGNSGAMQWGDGYRVFHEQAWTEAVRVLRPGGRFVLNIKDHIRAGEHQDVAGWHLATLQRLGGRIVALRTVAAAGNRYGANGHLRVDAEIVAALDFQASR
jgi:hypothetical protein